VVTVCDLEHGEAYQALAGTAHGSCRGPEAKRAVEDSIADGFVGLNSHGRVVLTAAGRREAELRAKGRIGFGSR